MTPDYNKAAVKATETLIGYGIKKAPVSPLPILEQMENVIVTSFSDMNESFGDLPLFGANIDAVTSIHKENGTTKYVVAYNNILPFSVIQRALARELGHIVLQHEGTSPENAEEALCFARHLLCPRPLIHAVQSTGIRVTKDLVANLTGIFEQTMVGLRRTPGTDVPAGMNNFVRRQFMPFVISIFDYYRSRMIHDGSALADFGTYMDNYKDLEGTP